MEIFVRSHFLCSNLTNFSTYFPLRKYIYWSCQKNKSCRSLIYWRSSGICPFGIIVFHFLWVCTCFKFIDLKKWDAIHLIYEKNKVDNNFLMHRWSNALLIHPIDLLIRSTDGKGIIGNFFIDYLQRRCNLYTCKAFDTYFIVEALEIIIWDYWKNRQSMVQLSRGLLNVRDVSRESRHI